MLYYSWVGIFTEQQWLFFKGYNDAKLFLAPQLDKYNLGTPLSTQVRSMYKTKNAKNPKVNFDIKTKTFI
jgi:hypothetical protein